MLGLATGCERLLSLQDPVADRGDAGGSDGGLPSSSPILLSEIALSPTAGEMIEIVNTSNQPVDLSTYYLSDSGNYYLLPAQATVDTSDFIVKFPQGTGIAGHGVMTIAIDSPANFATTYGMSPTFSVADTSMERIAMNGAARLTDAGEPIILFQWDRRSDRVRDVDILIAGMPMPSSPFPDKSGTSQDGPDPDTGPSTYATDLRTMKPQAAPPGMGVSTKRIALEAGHETQSGTGNGQSGDDETSEDTSVTWDGTAAHPFTAPSPGIVELQLP